MESSDIQEGQIFETIEIHPFGGSRVFINQVKDGWVQYSRCRNISEIFYKELDAPRNIRISDFLAGHRFIENPLPEDKYRGPIIMGEEIKDPFLCGSAHGLDSNFMQIDLKQLLLDKIKELGSATAAGKWLGSPTNIVSNWQKDVGFGTVHVCQKVLDEYLRKQDAARVSAEAAAKAHGPGVVPPQGKTPDLTVSASSLPVPVPQVITPPIPKPILPPPAVKHLIGDGRKIYFCAPLYKHVEPPTHACTIGLFQRVGEQLIWEPMIGASAWTARNAIANRIYRNPAKLSAIWLDDDMIFPNGNIDTINYFGAKLPKEWEMNIVERLATRGQKLVSGLYVQRQEKGRAQFEAAYSNEFANTDAHVNVPRNELKPVQWFGGGCFFHDWSVLDAIAKKFPDLHDEQGNIGFFTPTHGWSEDKEFCVRAKEAGVQAYVDMGCIVGHRGHKDFWPHNSI